MEYPRQLNLQTFEERQETDKWSVELVQKMHTLEKQLEIATKALEYYADENNYCQWALDEDGDLPEEAQQALKEMEGVK